MMQEPPLDIVSAHKSDGSVRPGDVQSLLQMVEMAVMERVVFCDQSDNFHEILLVSFFQIDYTIERLTRQISERREIHGEEKRTETPQTQEEQDIQEWENPDDRRRLTEDVILDMLDHKQYKELKEELENNMYPVDLADILEEFDQKHLVMVFRLLAKEEAAETFTYMNSDMRELLINALTDSELEEVMEEMYLDDTVDVLEEMPANVVDRLLLATDEETRAQINQLLQYPEDSAGSVMNVDCIALRKEMTVAESILKIRQVGINKETIYTCYVTEKRKLIGRWM